MQIAPELHINKRTFQAALKDVSRAAKAVNLIYVSNSQEGIVRKRRGKLFYYLDGMEKVKDSDLLDRIRKMVIPPAWENVWICKIENGHLQVTGIDKLGRKQYRYHPLWNIIRSHTKFYRLLEFGRRLPAIRQQLEKDLSQPGFPKEKVLATVVSLLERTCIRIDNAFYEKLYGSFGLTTMKNKHVDITGTKMTFTFKGKKGVQHEIGLQSRRLARIVKGCKEIPGKELFEYVDVDGNVHKIDSGMVNEYLHTISCSDFSAKDFRTWAGTVQALISFKEVGGFETVSEMNHKIVAVYDAVAHQLGNTRTVCKKYYVHPSVVKLYTEQKLDKYIDATYLTEGKEPSLLSDEERILIQILESQ